MLTFALHLAGELGRLDLPLPNQWTQVYDADREKRSSGVPMSAHANHPALLALSALQARAIGWLWPSWLALGKLAILDAGPGLGKSLLALDCCARLSTGRAF